ncbi:MAG TPA: hypothetical protein VGB14_19215 [Acidimicrobiales bacterium]|jgi:hypothetical protein
MANTSRPAAEHNLLATFGDLTQARKAMQQLERAGVEAGDIVLHGGDTAPATGAAAREQDVAVTKHVAKWAIGGAVIGGIVSGAILVLVINLIGVEPRMPASVASFIAGFLFGGAIVGFWTGGKEIPVNAEALEDTFGRRVDGTVAVAVHTDDAGLAGKAEDVLRGLGSADVRRYGRDATG